MQARTQDFALHRTLVFRALLNIDEAKIIGKKFLRSITLVGANYRAICRAKSQADYFSELSIVVEEADETLFWLELMLKAGILDEHKLSNLMVEANELLSIFASARKNSKISK